MQLQAISVSRRKLNGATMKPRTVSLKSDGMTLEIKLPRTMSAHAYRARHRAELTALRRHYCNVFAFWKDCRCKPCRKARGCAGSALLCLQRHIAAIPRDAQFAARQRLLDATPANIGAPERLARQCMPHGLCA
jgi:hypothetical protein